MNPRVYLYLIGAGLLVAIGVYFGKGCAPDPAPVQHDETHTVLVRERIDTVRVPQIHVERIAGQPIYVPLTNDTACLFHVVEQGDTIDARVRKCELEFLTVGLAPRPVIVRDSVIRDSIRDVVERKQNPLSLSAFVQTNVLHGINLLGAAVGATGTLSFGNLTLFAQPTVSTTEFRIDAGLSFRVY